MENLTFKEITKNDYQEYCEGRVIDWLQTVEFADLLKMRNWTPSFFGVFSDDELIFAGFVAGRAGRYNISMLSGVEADNLDAVEVFVKGVKEFCDNQKAISLSIFPRVIENIRGDDLSISQPFDNDALKAIFADNGFAHNSGFVEGFSQNTNTLIYRKDVEGLTVDEVEATYRQSHRRSFRKVAKVEGIEISEIQTDELEDFWRCIFDSNQKNGVGTKKLDYYQKFKQSFGEKAKFMAVKLNGEVIVAGVFVVGDDETIYFEGGSKKEHLKIPAMPVLQNHMIKETIKLGKKYYNFYGISGDKNSSLLRFKAGYHGEAVEYIGEFRKVWPTRRLFNKFSQKWKAVKNRI